METPEAPAKPAPPAETPSRLGRFIQTYHSFMSTFVIGAAGLIATSIWQYKQSEISRRQTDSQQAIAEEQAANQWRIERAEILAKNLEVLSLRGPTSTDQRYGVLLSLTRGTILDPELAVSYALELGDDNPDYMKSVLASTTDKDYRQLAHAFTVTCAERYGLARQVDICKGDEGARRSRAIAEIVSDDTETWALTVAPAAQAGGTHERTPVDPLTDDEAVRKDPWRYTALYGPAITSLYQKRQFAELRRIEGVSEGAHLVAALVVARSRTGEATLSDEDPVELLHAAERAWLAADLAARTCDDDCRSRFADFLLTGLADTVKDHGGLVRGLLERPPAEAAPSLEKLQARFLRCQVESADAATLRDQVLVPALGDLLGQPRSDANVLADLVGLLALQSEPTDPVALAAWNAVLARYQALAPDKHKTGFVERRASADEQRQNPPASTRRISFCKAPDPQDAAGARH